jgi:hypothetical protein
MRQPPWLDKRRIQPTLSETKDGRFTLGWGLSDANQTHTDPTDRRVACIG